MNPHQEERIVIELLKQTGLPLLDAALLLTRLIQESKGRGGKFERARKCIELGAASLRSKERTVTFARCVHESLNARSHRRPRTLSDIRFISGRFMRLCPKLDRRKIRSITSDECRSYIETAFNTPRQRHKARLILSSIFSMAVKRGWCAENPVARIDAPHVAESPVRALTPVETDALLKTAAGYDGGSCLAAVSLMLFGGIRPHEVRRLTWSDIDREGKTVVLRPCHTKTGGSRHVTIQPVLDNLLRQHEVEPGAPVCPPNWNKKWRILRRLAGWDGFTVRWQQDCLRHTFASYHLKKYGDYTALQLEMGHRDTNLLRTRYVNMTGITARNAELFWRKRSEEFFHAA